MQTTEAKKLREQWGDKPCSHPETEKEYYLGTPTGDHVCIVCGEEFGSINQVFTIKNEKE